MKQDLWLINSSLILIFILVVGSSEFLQQEPPVWRYKKRVTTPVMLEDEKKQEPATPAQAPVATWEKIYLEDIFGTYVPQQEIKAIKQSLLTPIPEPRALTIPPPPEVKKQEFIPALTITLRGIIAGEDETRNVAMIADETNKESIYHLGDKVKDAQIIKIAKNRVVLLRANGQQEVYLLRRDELAEFDTPPAEKWKYVLHKINDQNFEVDPQAFAHELVTLGNFIDRASIVGTVFQAGIPIGIRIGKPDPQDVSAALGLVENDVITTINGLNIADQKNRIRAYDLVTAMNLGGVIQVGLKRANKDIVLSYKLAKIEKPHKSIFPGIKLGTAANPPPADEAFKLSKLQQRDQTMRTFEQQHPEQQHHQQTMMDIRKRILDGLQNRFQNTRSRP